MLRIGSLFSGIGGLELGLERAGLGRTAWQCENDLYCRAVLRWHWPNVRLYDDVQTLSHPPRVSILCGGFPCQDTSVAGKGAGLKGARSGLWRHFLRIAKEIRPAWIVVENVAAGKTRWLHTVRRDLHLLGYASTAVALSAADVGAPHLRKRIFVIAYPIGKAVRIESRWGLGASRQGSSLGTEHGAAWPPSDAHGARKLESQRRITKVWQRSRDGAWRYPRSPILGVDDGVPHRVDRERALGNAVVPQCAQVIGRMIIEAMH